MKWPAANLTQVVTLRERSRGERVRDESHKNTQNLFRNPLARWLVVPQKTGERGREYHSSVSYNFFPASLAPTLTLKPVSPKITFKMIKAK
jgi:hypothetical protein